MPVTKPQTAKSSRPPTTAPKREGPNNVGGIMKRHALSVLGYILATFVTQATSHFMIFSEHYAAVAHIKAEPIFVLGFLSMIIQGSVVSFVFANSRFVRGGLFDAISFAWLFGAFLVSYIALAEAAKYSVPNVLSWIAVEIAVGSIQFTLVGIALWLANGMQRTAQISYSSRR